MDAIMFALLAALMWGITPILDKKGMVDIDPDIGVAIRAVAVVVVTILYLLYTGRTEALVSVNPRNAAIIALAGVIAAIFGQLAFYYALERGGAASLVVPVTSLYVLVAAVLGVLLLGEKMTLDRVIEVVLIVGGMVLIR